VGVVFVLLPADPLRPVYLFFRLFLVILSLLLEHKPMFRAAVFDDSLSPRTVTLDKLAFYSCGIYFQRSLFFSLMRPPFLTF